MDEENIKNIDKTNQNIILSKIETKNKDKIVKRIYNHYGIKSK